MNGSHSFKPVAVEDMAIDVLKALNTEFKSKLRYVKETVT